MLVDIIRAWKDPEYRQSLSPVERAGVPAHPAGVLNLPRPVTLTPEEVQLVAAGVAEALSDGENAPDQATVPGVDGTAATWGMYRTEEPRYIPDIT
jgi:mersacidin/lichenicidin family type 2 lantibiotic